MRPFHPTLYFTSSYDPQRNRTVFEPSGTTPGMTVGHYFLGQILAGLASNPTTMLNIEEHLDYAVRLAVLAAQKTDGWN